MQTFVDQTSMFTFDKMTWHDMIAASKYTAAASVGAWYGGNVS